ncbi:MAG: NAD(P)H-hydrate dehydratase [bacterium]|nr:NAD(P)H-hydrate dehydratase [bacterium]
MIEVDENLIISIMPKRFKDSNKGDYGKVLNITGSKNYTGAGMLSALAALKVGAGYSILCSDEYSINASRSVSCDVIYKSHKNFDFEIVKAYIEEQKIDSIVFGCGIGVDSTTTDFTGKLIEYLKTTEIPTVVDADGINCLAKIGVELNKNFILTPHPAELARLLYTEADVIQEDRENYIRKAQEQFKVTIILKGYNTLIADNEHIYKNRTGTSALSKAGTGDVLAGMIGGFLAQNVSVRDAAILSVYLHGISSQVYTDEYSEYSMLASDLLDYIPLAIKEVCSSPLH